MDEYAVDLLQRCMNLTPSTRISAKEALNHPYFDDVDKSKFHTYKSEGGFN